LAFQSKKNGSGEEIFPDAIVFSRHEHGKVQYAATACDSLMTCNGKEMSGWLASAPATNLPRGNVNGIRYCLDKKTLRPVAPWLKISIDGKWTSIDKFCWDEDGALLTDATAFLPKPVKLNSTASGFKFTLEFKNTSIKWPGSLDLSYEKLLSSVPIPSSFGLTPIVEVPDIRDDLDLLDEGAVVVPRDEEVVESEGVVIMPPLGLVLDPILDGTIQLMDRYMAACSDNEFKAQRISVLEAQRATHLTDLKTIKDSVHRLEIDLKTSKDSVHRLEIDLKTSKDNEARSLARIHELETALSKKRKAEELDRESIKRSYSVSERLTAILKSKPSVTR
jgi:hypothetical protein